MAAAGNALYLHFNDGEVLQWFSLPDQWKRIGNDRRIVSITAGESALYLRSADRLDGGGRRQRAMGGFIPLPVENSFTYGIQPENCNVEPARSRRTKILQVKEKRHPFSVAG
jgi:hypothetical protein